MGRTHLDICVVETVMPLHNRIIRPVSATATSNLVRVRKTINAFHGGNLALADFQVTPPFGKIMSISKLRLRSEGREGLGYGGSTSDAV